METFHQDVTCPKCGSDRLRVEWMPARDEREVVDRAGLSAYHFMPIDRVPDDAKRADPAEPERLEIDCLRCFYGWVMAPVSEAASR